MILYSNRSIGLVSMSLDLYYSMNEVINFINRTNTLLINCTHKPIMILHVGSAPWLP